MALHGCLAPWTCPNNAPVRILDLLATRAPIDLPDRLELV